MMPGVRAVAGPLPGGPGSKWIGHASCPREPRCETAAPAPSPFVSGFTLTLQQRSDLKAFPESLTDEDFLHNPQFANPWPSREH
jgi:hypothetical protein